MLNTTDVKSKINFIASAFNTDIGIPHIRTIHGSIFAYER